MVTMHGVRFDATPLKRAFLVWGRGYRKLAEIAGCVEATAFNVVNGRTPTSKHLRTIAGILEVDLAKCWKVEEDRP